MSGRMAVFVDAGYLFKKGAMALFDAPLGRHYITLDSKSFINGLTEWARIEFSNDELFRTYWYDGVRDGVPTSDQLEVAALPYVKFRRGRINGKGQQKGVDTLIVRDLMVLSQERSIQRAIVLSGDEDLREGIEYAQDRGVHATVLGIKARGSTSQSLELVREADQVLLVPPDLLGRTLTRVAPEGADVIGTETADVRPVSVTLPDAVLVSTPVNEAARDCARAWLTVVTPAEVAALVARRPSLPSALDGELLRFVVRRTGIYTLDDVQRRQARVSFWEIIDKDGHRNPAS